MRCVSIVLLVLVSAAPALAQEPRKIAAVEGVSEYRLANGARVLLFPEMSRPTITVNMTVLLGSRHEGYGESGMAHVLEHMVVTNLHLGRTFAHIQDMEKRIASLTPEEVTAACRKHIDPKTLVIIRAGNFKK